MIEDIEASKAIIAQLTSVSDAELGAIFRQLLARRHREIGLDCDFPYDKQLNKYDYSQPPIFEIYSRGCGCCADRLTNRHSNVLDVLADLLGDDQQLTNEGG